jgi:hypothetical protein
MTAASESRRAGPRRLLVALAVLPASLGSAFFPTSEPADGDRTRAIEAHVRAVERLRDGARAAAAGDAAAFARALGEAARAIETLLERATWLSAAEREDLGRTARWLLSRAEDSPEGFSPDADLAVLDRVGHRLRGGTGVELVFEGSFARRRTGEVEEPAYGGHATAMAPPPAPPPPGGDAGPGHGVRFVPVRGQLTERAYAGGPSRWHLLETGGNGLALLDFDGDGRLDIYAVSAFSLDERNERAPVPHPNALYRNLGGMRFENVARAAGVDAAAWGYGVCAGDYDDDGRLDLYITNYGPDILFRNRGDGTFENAAERAGVAQGGWSTGCAFFDADGDGDLDLYVARYVTAPWEEVANPGRFLMWRGAAKVMLGPAGLPGAADVFFENRGDGRFEEATRESGLADAARAYGFAVVATDYDGDGWTDLFVANDSNPDYLYRNDEGRRFVSSGLAAGVALNAEGRAQAGMGADAGDYDGDGRIDLAVTTFAFDHNSLFRNLGDRTFEDVTRDAGIAAPTFRNMSWGVAFLDADLDGDLDLFFANGHLFPQVDEHPDLQETYAQKDQLFLNEEGRFRDVSPSAGPGLDVLAPSRALAAGDLDDDGDPDLVVAAMDDEPTLLENVQQSGNHWLGIALRRRGPNAFGIGARVDVDCPGIGRQVREVRSGGGYLSQSDLRALFGLGGCEGPATVDVRLLGEQWRFEGVAVDRHATLVLDDTHRVGP